MEVRLLMLERSCGVIIGTAGENISRLRNQYNVHLHMPSTSTVDRTFTVKGGMDNCIGVIEDVMACSTQQGPYPTNPECRVELNLLVQTSMIGSILGKGGRRIKEIREATNATVKVYEKCLPRSNERVIAIGGDENEQVVVALSAILDIVKDIPYSSPTRYYKPGDGQKDTRGYDSDHGGKNKQRCDSWSSCSNDHGGGSERDWGNSSVFAQLHTVMEITAPNNICGAIIGKGRSRVRKVGKESGANITFSESDKDNNGDRVITISGTQSQVQTAQQLITQQCSEYVT